MSVRSIVVLTVLGAFGLVGTGCGYSASDYCNDACDCEGCSDNELDECIDTEDMLRKWFRQFQDHKLLPPRQQADAMAAH